MRRCLECDHVYSDPGACPLCGSAKTLVLDERQAEDSAEHQAAGLLFLAHGLLMTAITVQQPGFALGSLMAGCGVSSLLLFAGVEQAPRIIRSLAALLLILQVLLACATGQGLLFGPGAVMTLCALLLLHPDPTASWLPAMRWTGWGCALLLAILAIVHLRVHPVPGWWQGRQLPWETLAPTTPGTVPGAAPLPKPEGP